MCNLMISCVLKIQIIYKFLQKAGLMKIHPMVRGALMRRNTWETQNEAVEYFKRKKLFRNISKNIIEDYDSVKLLTDSIIWLRNENSDKLFFSNKQEVTIDTSSVINIFY